MRIRILGHTPVDLLIVHRAELKTLTLAPGVPNQIGQESTGIVIAQHRVVRQGTVQRGFPTREMHTVGGKEMPMHARPAGPAEPMFEILENLGKALKHRIGRGGDAILPILVGKTALHIKPRAAPGAPLHRLGKDAVDLAGVRLGLFHRTGRVGQEGIIEPVRMGPNLACHETIRAAQKLEVIVVKDMRFALKIELRQGQRPAFDLAGIEPCKGLEIAFVRDPNMAKELVVGGPVGVLQDRRQGAPGQAPPLRAHMRHDPARHPAFQPQQALHLDRAVEQIAIAPP